MNGEALHHIPGTTSQGHAAHGPLQLFAAALLCRPLEQLTANVEALVRAADNEAARMAAAGRIDVARRDAAAYRLTYRALRDLAAAVGPLEISSEPRWMRALDGLSRLRHRQRALLILDAMTPLSAADAAEATGVAASAVEGMIATAVATMARALGGPADVRRDLRLAAKNLAVTDQPTRQRNSSTRAPRSVVRRLLAPQMSVPRPPAFTIEASAVEALLALSEAEPRDIVPADAALPSPTPPKPPAPVPAQRASRLWLPRASVVALSALVLVLAALLPQVSRAVRRPEAPKAPAVHAVTVAPRAAARTPSPVPPPSVRVRRGDTLWAIAGRVLGDPRRWPELWRLNHGARMPGGRRFTEPSLIMPGWVLLLPIPG
ncbi:MAG: hypothetical protein ACXVES_11785 [Actinomycetota bacterium]